MVDERKYNTCVSYLITAERDLSHALSDAGTFNIDYSEFARRVMRVRDMIRKALDSLRE